MGQDFFLKYILVGNTSVGKSAILHRFIKHNYKDDTIATVGVDYRARNINVEDKSFGLMIWDTAGMEAYRSFTQAYYRATAVAIFVYDITNRDSFLALTDWIDTVYKNCSDITQLVTVIVGNKSDLQEQRAVEFDEAQQLAKTYNALFYEVSAVIGTNVDEAFETAAHTFYAKYKQGMIDITSESHGILLGPRQLDMASKGGEGGSCMC